MFDTLQVLFISYDLEHNLGIHNFRSTWLFLIIKVLTAWAKFLELSAYYDQLNLHLSLNICFCLLPQSYGQVRSHIACSWIWLRFMFICAAFKLYTEWSHALHYMSVHQLLRYNQSQWLSSMVWTASIKWYMHYKLAHTKI